MDDGQAHDYQSLFMTVIVVIIICYVNVFLQILCVCHCVGDHEATVP